MDEHLEQRYLMLFNLYALHGSRELKRLYELLFRWSEENNNRLRGDALYFLLVNFNEMLLQPYTSYLNNNLPDHFTRPYNGFSPSDFMPRLEESLNIILNEALEGNYEVPMSGHSIMRIIDNKWGELSALLMWG